MQVPGGMTGQGSRGLVKAAVEQFENCGFMAFIGFRGSFDRGGKPQSTTTITILI
jgi:hypothetical protein